MIAGAFSEMVATNPLEPTEVRWGAGVLGVALAALLLVLAVASLISTRASGSTFRSRSTRVRLEHSNSSAVPATLAGVISTRCAGRVGAMIPMLCQCWPHPAV